MTPADVEHENNKYTNLNILITCGISCSIGRIKFGSSFSNIVGTRGNICSLGSITLGNGFAAMYKKKGKGICQ